MKVYCLTGKETFDDEMTKEASHLVGTGAAMRFL